MTNAQQHSRQAADTPTLTINASQPGPRIPETLYGTFFEEINFAGDGGLYGELLRNRGFNEDRDTPVHWSFVREGSAQGGIRLDRNNPFNAAHPQSLQLYADRLGENERIGIANSGYWGIPVQPQWNGRTDAQQDAGCPAMVYTARIFAMATPTFRGPLTLTIESGDGSRIYARGQIDRLDNGWQEYSVSLAVAEDVTEATTDTRFVIALDYTVSEEDGTPEQVVWLGYTSLFPPTWHNQPNGNRIDLMQKLAALQPGFFRFPGGNYLEGNTIGTRFAWQDTLGPVWRRPGHRNTAWDYWSDDGPGLLEYLRIAEDLGATPVLGVWAGYTLNGTVVPRDELGPWVQSALDEIEYAIGPVTSRWGSQRARDGHPEPFDLRYVEIGNEDFFDNSGSYNNYRYPMFYDAIKTRYPELQVIASARVDSRPMDILDVHFYDTPEFFIRNAHRYDEAPRSGPKIFVGEFAVTSEGIPTGTLDGAIGEAAFMTGLERNADKVIMSCYAPLFVRVGHRQWSTNLIGFDGLESFGSPSYYVQKLFSRHTGDEVLPISGPADDDSSVVPQTDRWYQLVGVYDRDVGQLKLYIDGELQALVDYAADDAWQATGHLVIGRGLYDGNPVDFAEGRIDDVRLYDRALSDAEVQLLPADGLAGRWTFDENSSDTVADIAGEHPGVLQGGAERGKGRISTHAVCLDGDDDYVDIPAAVVDTRQSFTVAAWVNPDTTDGFQTYISVDGEQVSGFYLQLRGDTGRFAFSRIPADSVEANSDVVYASIGEVSALQYVASRDRQHGTIYLKVVNTADTARQAEICLDGVDALASVGTALVLTGESGDAQNSLDQPRNVAPVEQQVSTGASFSHEFPANSVTVLELPTG